MTATWQLKLMLLFLLMFASLDFGQPWRYRYESSSTAPEAGKLLFSGQIRWDQPEMERGGSGAIVQDIPSLTGTD